MEYKIEESEVHQGDLILLIHKEKPVKSGWWRKVRLKKKEIVYVLEKPIHKDFSLRHKDIMESRIENGYCVMKSNTLSYGQNILNKFIIFAKAGALSQQYIMNNNYLLGESKKNFDELSNFDDFTTSTDGDKFFELYFNKDKTDIIKDLVKNTIK
ncbi:TPA: hypothetical protein LA460_000082 [Clostridium botulinum]|nr:hypothetical protein [Clostridium botulinum]HBJ1652687.1 hypothetical protein [Clostridium botulinum]